MPGAVWIPFGRLTRAHGVRGELRLVPHNRDDDFPRGIERVRIEVKSTGPQVVEVERVRSTSGAVLITFGGVEDRNSAAALAGAELCLAKEDLPSLSDGEFYLHELVGLRAVDEDSEDLGIVAAINEVQGRDLIVIVSPHGERLLPLTDDTVQQLDRSGGLATVRVPPGLWE